MTTDNSHIQDKLDNMEYDKCERFTVDLPDLPFLHVAVVRKENGILYLDAVYPHNRLVIKINFTHKLHRWVDAVASVATCQHALPECVVRGKPARGESGRRVDAHLLATDALVAWAVTTAVTNQAKPQMKVIAIEWFTKICNCAIEANLSNMREFDATFCL